MKSEIFARHLHPHLILNRVYYPCLKTSWNIFLTNIYQNRWVVGCCTEPLIYLLTVFANTWMTVGKSVMPILPALYVCKTSKFVIALISEVKDFYLLFRIEFSAQKLQKHSFMQILWLSYIAQEWDQDQYRDQMERTVHCGNVHTGRKQWHGPEPIVS